MVEEKDREIGGEKLGRYRKKKRKNNFDKESTLNNIQREGLLVRYKYSYALFVTSTYTMR